MCGRFVQASSPALLAEHFRVDEVTLGAPVVPSYNVAPRAEVLTVVDRHGSRRMGQMRWGLVPSWAPDPSVGDRMINARAESVLEKPAFRAAFERRRCILPADGFYEWQTMPAPGRKQPMYLHARSGAPLAMAGLWEAWRDPESPDDTPWLRTCAVITTDANSTVAPIHDRMPVMLAAADWEEWLDRDADDVGALTRLLRPAPDDLLEAWPVNPRVGNAARGRPVAHRA